MADYSIPKALDISDISAKNKGYLDQREFELGNWLISPKYDGCAVRIDIRAGKVTSMVSASGKPVRSLGHLIPVLEKALGPTEPNVVLCAEAWTEGRAFQDISGMFRRHSEQSDLHLQVFDGYFTTPTLGYKTRMQVLDWYLNRSSVPRVHVVPLRTATALSSAWGEAFELVAAGGCDGAVLHWAGKPFTEGRSKWDCVKLKPLLTYDVLVTGVQKGVGEATGRPTAALICRWVGGSSQEVATGLTEAQQADPEQFVGKIIEIAGMGLTTAGKLREPRFIGVREDKLTPEF